MSPYPTKPSPVASHPIGLDYLQAITGLLQRARLEDSLAGLYEAADLQWWWREDDAEIPDRQTFWSLGTAPPFACFLLFDDTQEWNCDSFWVPSHRETYQSQVWPRILERLDGLDKPSTFTVREDETTLRADLESHEFETTAYTAVQLVLHEPPALRTLPAGFVLESRTLVEADRVPESPHPMRPRNGDRIEAKLRECSLYRPDLDLAVRAPDGRTAAYGLFWYDPVTSVGLVEPMRTEDEFQGRGLARCLLAEGIDRLRRQGAQIIKISYRESNVAAQRLYTTSGFRPVGRKLEYRKGPEPETRQSSISF